MESLPLLRTKQDVFHDCLSHTTCIGIKDLIKQLLSDPYISLKQRVRYLFKGACHPLTVELSNFFIFDKVRRVDVVEEPGYTQLGLLNEGRRPNSFEFELRADRIILDFVDTHSRFLIFV